MSKKRFRVKWEETRVFKCLAEVYANSKEEALEKVREYDINEKDNEWLEEQEYCTEEIRPPHAKEIRE